MTINEIIELQKNFDSSHCGNFRWNEQIDENSINILQFLIISLFGEVGETANIIKKIVRGDYKLEEKRDELSEEIIDVFIYLIKLSYQLNIDIEKEYISKMTKNEERFKQYENTATE